MIKFLARDSITFDCETVPDVEAIRRLYNLFPKDGDDLGFSSWSPRDFIEYGFMMHPDFDSKSNPRPFLKPILQRVVSIAAIRRTLTKDGVVVKLTVLDSPNEAELLDAFLKVGQMKPIQLVGFNSEQFDLPLIVQRALVNNLVAPQFCQRPAKPWEGIDWFAKYSDWHVDLMHELGGYSRGVPSLSETCAALNVLGGARETTGPNVLDLYLAGDLAAIHRHCAKDAVRQFIILLCLSVMAGFVTPEEANKEEADVVQQLEAMNG